MHRPWHILGAGAIGSLFAHAFHAAKVPVSLLVRTNQPTPRALHIVRGGQTLRAEVPICRATDAPPIERLLVCTKAYDVATALRSVRHRLTSDSVCVVLVNGMGLSDVAAQVCPPRTRIFAGTTTEGAYRLQDDDGSSRTVHAGSGTTLIGVSGGCGGGGRGGGAAPSPDWFEGWRRLPLDCRWEARIDEFLWRKLAVNCAVNPLTARHGCLNGELLERTALTKELELVCVEISAVLVELGFGHIPVLELARQVARATAHNRSSMLQDVRAGRQTEVEFITGHLCARAEELGVSVPFNRELLEEVRELSKCVRARTCSGVDLG